MFSKKAKLPKITSKTKLLCFDLETNGLHGQTFAIGAILMNASGKVLKEFSARTQIDGEVDEWVQSNVMSAIADMVITHDSFEAMQEDFWQWYLASEKECDYVLVSHGYPVEYRFLLQCQEVDIEKRYWDHPFPLLDLASILLMTGDKKSIVKDNVLALVESRGGFLRHHPVHDCTISALTAFEAFRVMGLIK